MQFQYQDLPSFAEKLLNAAKCQGYSFYRFKSSNVIMSIIERYKNIFAINIEAILGTQIFERIKRKRKFNDVEELEVSRQVTAIPIKLFPLLLGLLLKFVKKRSEISPRNKTSIAKMISYFVVTDLKTIGRGIQRKSSIKQRNFLVYVSNNFTVYF